jgi:hypothetical protein
VDGCRALEKLVFSYAALVDARCRGGRTNAARTGSREGKAVWRFTERRATIDLVGDVSHHLRAKGP